jgi:hypothetical protein
LDHLQQCGGDISLVKKHVGPAEIGGRPNPWVGQGTGDDDSCGWPALLDASGHFEPVGPRYHDVDYDEIGPFTSHEFECCEAIFRFKDQADAGIGSEHYREKRADVCLVIDDEHCCRHGGALWGRQRD